MLNFSSPSYFLRPSKARANTRVSNIVLYPSYRLVSLDRVRVGLVAGHRPLVELGDPRIAYMPERYCPDVDYLGTYTSIIVLESLFMAYVPPTDRPSNQPK